MAKKKVELSESEQVMVEAMRKRPEMKARIESILAMSLSTEGKVKKADEIEAMLIEELRALGASTIKEWAAGAEQAIGQTHQKENPGSYCAKKKT